MKALIITFALLPVVFIAGFNFGVTWHISKEVPLEPEIIYLTEYVPVETITVIRQEVIKEKIVGVEGLREFETLKELNTYVAIYRTNRMIQYGEGQCEDYAYDFMLACLGDGYIASTELVTSTNGWHMANTVPVGNIVYLVDISSGTIKAYGLKD